MSAFRVEVRIFALGQKKPLAKLEFDETTIGQIPGEVFKFVAGLVMRGA